MRTLVIALTLVACGARTGLLSSGADSDASSQEDGYVRLDATVDGSVDSGSPQADAASRDASDAPNVDVECRTGLTVLDSEDQPVQGITVDEHWVYWTTGDKVMRATKCGGAHSVLASGQNYPVKIVVDAANAYWTNWASGGGAGSVAKVSLSGGLPTTIADRQRWPVGIAVDTARIYWTDGATVKSAPLSGGLVNTLARGQGNALEIAISATTAYWIDEMRGTVVSAPLEGGSVTTLVDDLSFPSALALDETNVYWAAGDPLIGFSVQTQALGGGPIQTVAADKVPTVALAVDATMSV